MQAHVGVILCGAGHRDGSELSEAVLALYYLDRAGVRVTCYAPHDIEYPEVNHLTGKNTEKKLNALVESARIARGHVKPLNEANAEDLDALVIPGGYGIAKNLSTYPTEGEHCHVHLGLQTLICNMLTGKKPIIAICIAPVLLARMTMHIAPGLKLTIGSDTATSKILNAWGEQHVACADDDIVIDERYRVITTPAYMLANGPAPIGIAIEKAVHHMMKWLS